MNSVTVAIVTFNSRDVIDASLPAAFATNAETIVVDNASIDGTPQSVRRYPQVRLIANSTNAGFAAAVNQAFRESGSSLVLILNPDAILSAPLHDLVAAFDDPEVGAAAGRLLDSHGAFQTGFSVRRLPSPLALVFEVLGFNRLFPSNPVNRRYRCLDLDPSQPCDVEQPAGAFLMIRREAWTRISGFDEAFHPVWFEDVDFCKRLLNSGYRIRYVPSCTAHHSGGHSVRRLDWQNREQYWYGSLLKYAGKHFPRTALASVCVAVVGGVLLRSVTGIFRHASTKPLLVYGKVIRLACRYILFGGTKSGTGKTFINQAQIHVL